MGGIPQPPRGRASRLRMAAAGHSNSPASHLKTDLHLQPAIHVLSRRRPLKECM